MTVLELIKELEERLNDGRLNSDRIVRMQATPDGPLTEAIIDDNTDPAGFIIFVPGPPAEIY